MMEREFRVDIESFGTVGEEVSTDPNSCTKLEGETLVGSANVDWSVKGGKGENLGGEMENGNKFLTENKQVLIEIDKNVVEVVNPLEKKSKKEKRKTMSAKKHPKPPRPPRGLSMDAADQKLIKELAMMKRARIERMKVLKKMKVAKGSSGGSFFAMISTVLFCVVIVCQGMSSRVNSAVSINSPLVSPEAVESSFIAVENHMSLSRNDSDSTPPSGSSR